MTDPRATIIKRLIASPGGLTGAEVRIIMGRHDKNAQTAVDAMMASISGEYAIWEEIDDQKETWYHHPCHNKDYLTRWRIEDKREAFMSDKYKRDAKRRQVGCDDMIVRKVEHFLIDNGKKISLAEFFSRAAEEKLERELNKRAGL